MSSARPEMRVAIAATTPESTPPLTNAPSGTSATSIDSTERASSRVERVDGGRFAEASCFGT